MMNALGPCATILPTVDPLGYPVPLVVLQGLSYLTLTLHLLAMSFTLGGALLWVFVRLSRPACHESINRYLGSSLTLGFSYLVTLGIPPLLFVQVIYGQLFYSSSVLIGAHWILVIPLLVLAYGLFYLHKLTRESRPGRQVWFVGLGVLAMLAIGFFYVNNLTLAQTPERWLSLYQEHPGGGTLNWGEETLWPRFLVFVVPAFVVAGLGIVLAGAFLRRWEQDEKGLAYQRLGRNAFLLGGLAEAGVGAWFMATLPDPIRSEVMAGGLSTLLLGAGAGLALVATVLLLLGSRKRGIALPILAAVTLVLAVGAFVALRDQVRLLYLDGIFNPAQVQVHAQWVMFALFVVTLGLGLILVGAFTTVVVRNLASDIAGKQG